MKLLQRKFTLMIAGTLAICLFNLPLFADVLTEQVEAKREEILQGPYGQQSAEELVDATIEATGTERRWMVVAMAVRKSEVLPIIKEKLQTGSNKEKYQLLMFSQHSLRWTETVPAIQQILQDNTVPERTRARAAVVLAFLQEKQAIPDIRYLLKSTNDNQVRELAARALSFLGDSANIDAFENMLQDASPFIQIAGAMCLGMLGNDVGLDTALALSQHESFGRRLDAAEALSYINSPRSLQRLHEMQADDPSSTVRNESAAYIAKVELAAMEKDAALNKLKSMFHPDDPYPPRWAFVYLMEHFANEVVDFLQILAESPGALQEAATIALLEIDSGKVTYPDIRRKNK